MDDIIYDASHTNPDTITQYCNCMHHNLELNATLENNDRDNFLYLSIIRDASQLEIGFFLKPTTTDTTISYLYIHPNEQKLAAYRYYTEIMFNLPSMMTDYTMSGKPSTSLPKTTNSQLPYSTN
jgi:hypothetical protein